METSCKIDPWGTRDVVTGSQRSLWTQARYFVTLYNYTSAGSFVRFIQTTNQTVCGLKEMVVEMQSVASNSGRVRLIRMARGWEYAGGDLRNWFTEKCMIPKYSPPYSTESNGLAERLHRTLLGKAHAMMNPMRPIIRIYGLRKYQ